MVNPISKFQSLLNSMLCRQGPDPHVALIRAAEAGQTQTVQTLLDAGASVDFAR